MGGMEGKKTRVVKNRSSTTKEREEEEGGTLLTKKTTSEEIKRLRPLLPLAEIDGSERCWKEGVVAVSRTQRQKAKGVPRLEKQRRFGQGKKRHQLNYERADSKGKLDDSQQQASKKNGGRDMENGKSALQK